MGSRCGSSALEAVSGETRERWVWGKTRTQAHLRCQRCGHTFWSYHPDAVRLAQWKREGAADAHTG